MAGFELVFDAALRFGRGVTEPLFGEEQRDRHTRGPGFARLGGDRGQRVEGQRRGWTYWPGVSWH